MASDKDVLGKADALLRRHAAGTEAGGVPVLTDLVHDPRAKAAAEELAREIFTRVLARRVYRNARRIVAGRCGRRSGQAEHQGCR